MSMQDQPASGGAQNAARIFVESFLGQILVYTDLPASTELRVVEAVWADPDQETLDNRALLQQLLERGEIRELPQTANWVLTDDACWQCRRRISERKYELIRVQDLGMEYGILRGIVDVDDYTLDGWEDYLRGYDYGGLRDFIAGFGNALPLGVLAECIFETEWESYLMDERFRTLSEAVQYIAGVADCTLPDADEAAA